MSDVQTTHLGRNWLLKTLLFMALLLGFGVWGLVDALYFYPKRGEMDAARRLKEHLAAAQVASLLTPSKLKIDDPVGTMAKLHENEKDLSVRAVVESPDGRAAKVEETRLRWLESLNRMWKLKPEPRLVFTDKGPPVKKLYYDMREGEGYWLAPDGTKARVTPPELLGILVKSSNTSNQVTPLSGFDMLFQWVFVTIGFGGGLWMLATLVRALAKKYSWRPDTQQLTFPDGKSAVPADLKEIDKRQWHKFFVVMHLNDGAAYRLDLLRYQPLEDWVLEMERTAFPDQVEEEADAAA